MRRLLDHWREQRWPPSTAEEFGADPWIAQQVYRAMIKAFIDAEMKDWKR